MDLSGLGEKCRGWISKYKYVLLILALGVVLMCIPVSKEEKNDIDSSEKFQQEDSMEDRLEEILSQLQGAGKVEVILTIAEGERILYQYDEDRDISEHGTSEKKDTVIISDNNRNESAVITQILPPIYRGAIIVCQGADQASVRLAIVEAVSKATGLGADKICVLKMK